MQGFKKIFTVLSISTFICLAALITTAPLGAGAAEKPTNEEVLEDRDFILPSLFEISVDDQNQALLAELNQRISKPARTAIEISVNDQNQTLLKELTQRVVLPTRKDSRKKSKPKSVGQNKKQQKQKAVSPI